MVLYPNPTPTYLAPISSSSSSSMSDQEIVQELFGPSTRPYETEVLYAPQVSQGVIFVPAPPPTTTITLPQAYATTTLFQPAAPLQQVKTSWLGQPMTAKLQTPSSRLVTEEIQVPLQQPTATTTATTGAVIAPISSSILSSIQPLAIQEGETVTVQGETGILANRPDIVNWSGPLPLDQYPINEDPSPEIIRKQTDQQLAYTQEIAIRYLRPPTPPLPSDILIAHEKSVVPPPAPPIVIRQQPPRPETPPPLIIREQPPSKPPVVEAKVINIKAKQLPPPPRKVIIERLPPMPEKPQNIIIERWLPYKQHKRRVIYQRPEPEPVYEKVKNVIIQWEPPNVLINRELKDLGIVRADPDEYIAKYGSTLKRPDELPDFVSDIRLPQDLILAANAPPLTAHELYGDVHALNLIDLDREGLNAYRHLLLGQQQQAESLRLEPQTLSTATFATFPAAYQQSAISTEPLVYQQQQQPRTSHLKSWSQVSWSLNEPMSEIEIPIRIVTPQTTAQRFSNLTSTLNQILDSIQVKSKNRVTFNEAKSILAQLNQRMNRIYDVERVESFLSSINLKRDASIDLESFRSAVLNSYTF